MSKFSVQCTEAFRATVFEHLKGHLLTYDEARVEAYQLETTAMVLSVLHNPMLISADELSMAALEATGIMMSVKEDGNGGKVWDFSRASAEGDLGGDQDGEASTGGGIRPAIVLCGATWIVSMFSQIDERWASLSYVGLLAVFLGVPPIAKKACRTARRGLIDTNVLMLLAAIGAVALGQYDDAAAVTFLFSLSKWLEDRATGRATAALTSIVAMKPEITNIIQPKTKELVVVPAESVPVGATVAVRCGEKIPCDGIIVEGSSTVNESPFTGEVCLVKKGAEVYGGYVNSGNTQLIVRITNTSDDSAVSRLIRLVEEAQANRSETEKTVDAFAKVYTSVVVLTALVMCTLSWAWGPEVGRDWTGRGLSLIVIACPCALVISAPVAYVAGLAATAQNGVLVKGGAQLEALGQLKNLCFDKTGTLTVGEFKLLKLSVIGKGLKREQVLQHLALMEDRATHPMATSLVDGIKAEGVTVPASMFVNYHSFLPGEGIEGNINGKKVHVGNERLFRRLGFWDSIPLKHKKNVESWEGMGGTIGFMSIKKKVVCAYCVVDAPRPDAAGVLEELKAMGLTMRMLTGDRRETAISCGKKIGLDEADIKSELLPEQKLALVSQLKEEENGSFNPLLSLFFAKPRLVSMCGDGVNHAPSLLAADVGIAMGAGAALAMETADVTLMDSSLTRLLDSIKMGRSVVLKIRQNIIFSLVVKLIVLGLTLTDHVGLLAAICSDVGLMVIVTLNGMSLLPQKKEQEVTAAKESV